MKRQRQRVKKISYKSTDGTRLVGILSLPPQPRGFALMMHGITVDKDEWQGFYSDMARELARQGIGSLRFDFRGHGESGGSSLDVSIIGEILDVEASVRKLRKYWKRKIAFIATSLGAGPALLTASEIKSEVSHVVLVAPVLDYALTFLRPRTEWARASFHPEAFRSMKKKGYLLLDGEFKLSPRLIEEFRWIRPYEVLRSLEVPVLLIHGDKDSMVPFSVSKKYFDTSRGSRFVVLRNADHGFPDFGDDEGDSEKSLANKKRIFEEIVSWITAAR